MVHPIEFISNCHLLLFVNCMIGRHEEDKWYINKGDIYCKWPILEGHKPKKYINK